MIPQKQENEVEKGVLIQARLPKDLWHQASVFKLSPRITFNQLFEDALREYFASRRESRAA